MALRRLTETPAGSASGPLAKARAGALGQRLNVPSLTASDIHYQFAAFLRSGNEVREFVDSSSSSADTRRLCSLARFLSDSVFWVLTESRNVSKIRGFP